MAPAPLAKPLTKPQIRGEGEQRPSEARFILLFSKPYDDSVLREKIANLSEQFRELEAEMDRQRLKYEELYEIARRNLAKLAQRAGRSEEAAEPPTNGPDLNSYRKMLVQRKLGGK